MSRLHREARAVLDLLVASLFYWLGCRAAGAVLGSADLLSAGPHCLWSAAAFGVTVVLLFAHLELYANHGTLLNIGELARVIRGLALAAAVFLAALFLLGSPPMRPSALAGILLAAGAVVMERRVAASFLKRLQLAGRLGRRVLLYGCGETGERLMKKILQSPDLGCTVVGFLDDYATLGSVVSCRVSQASTDRVEARVLGRLSDLSRVVRDHDVDELLITIPSLSPWKLAHIVDSDPELNIEIGIVPRLGAFRADQLRVEDVSGIPVLRPYAFQRRGVYHAIKRALDISLSLTLLVLVAPAWALAWLLIRLDSPGPALFRQERIGLGGEPFEMYKFRTMYADVEAYARAPASAEDSRITRIGRWVRTAGFDETPQLINVLKGEMSLVGPRPEMLFIVEKYGELERQRLRALPGITGLWQLSADRASEIHENIEYDLYYIQNRSTLLDLAILVETVFFSVSVLVHRLLRLDTVWLFGKRPAPEAPAGPREGNGARSGGRFVLAALDQRMNGTLPEVWKSVLPALYEVAKERPVKVLVAERNVALIDEFVRDATFPGGVHSGSGPEYVPHSSRADLYRMSRQAELVLTDLADVAERVEDVAEVLIVDGGGRIRLHDGTSSESVGVRAVLLELGLAVGDGADSPLDLVPGS